MSTQRRAGIEEDAEPTDEVVGSRFGRWYRSRPLIGGILIVIAGIEMVLSGQLDLGSIHIQVGIEGMQAMILPFALVTLGVLIVAMPAHRLFYGIMCLGISIYAVVAVNLGGFIIGTILGIVGGLMCVSWAPKAPPVAGAVVSEESTDDAADPVSATTSPVRAHRGASSVLLIAALIVGVAATTQTAGPSFADAPPTAPVATGSPTPEPAPTASADPSPAPTPPAPTPPVAAQPAPAPPAAAVTPPAPVRIAPRVSPPVKAQVQAQAVAAPTIDPDAPVSAIPSVSIRSVSMTFNTARYIDTVKVPLADGSTATVLKITADAVSLGGFSLDSTDPAAHGLTTGASTLILSGPIILYCAALSGTLGDGTVVTFDPSSPPPAGVDLPSLGKATIALLTLRSAAASLAGAVETVH